MSHITANELKTKGVAAIESMLKHQSEAIVSVHGKDRYVVMEIKQYNYLRECELEAALVQIHDDLANGRFVKDSPEAHIERLKTAS